ncbi:transposase IS200 like family protein [Thioalkalivibrio nitratireducens DSM 14787]|uniref:Transposase IS200 like family protein n=1 Tax=Thioalkalivibrio nitratireducens (strain DSM 14787 / UNIQEM 213 / ALEN2) TaxID=1255043 RepID=L0DTK8_THIND|nr:IS200/IS605 family transposase [Thioalkalivibrio nitratireducens]AGA32332.1 transposase IS200 like family protein [Thioalkalivibrio nitratireducens DSM 14787]
MRTGWIIEAKRRWIIAPRYWKGTLWSPSYLAGSSGGAPTAIIRQYIEQQRTPP